MHYLYIYTWQRLSSRLSVSHSEQPSDRKVNKAMVTMRVLSRGVSLYSVQASFELPL